MRGALLPQPAASGAHSPQTTSDERVPLAFWTSCLASQLWRQSQHQGVSSRQGSPSGAHPSQGGETGTRPPKPPSPPPWEHQLSLFNAGLLCFRGWRRP